MSFAYLAGTTTPGAPDEIIDWFATFEAWIVGLGWIVAAGAGTTDLVLRSDGEGAVPPLTMLWLHVWRNPGNLDQVKMEVRDDLAGTHETTSTGFLDGGGAQFPFWMCGDMDAINVCFRDGATYHSMYAGMVYPFARTVPDETYRMIVTRMQEWGTILRDSTGVWDVDHNLWDNQAIDNALIDRYDGSYPLCGKFFDRQDNIAGQLKHITGLVSDAAISLLDALETGRGSRTTPWIVLQDRVNIRYAMRTGGVLPTGTADPASFRAVTGVAADLDAFWTALSTHLTGLGWTDLGDPGLPGMDSGRLYFSAGESGQDEIYIGYAWDNAIPDRLYYYVQDDLAGTHRAPLGGPLTLEELAFPIDYWICGDRDCCVVVFHRFPAYALIWSGLLPAFAPGLLAPYVGPPLTVYQLVAGARGDGLPTAAILRGHDGAWNQFIGFADDGADADNSNPNNFDGVTYLVWPLVASEGWEMLGQLRYVGYSSGGGIGNMDTITVADQVYTAFFDDNDDNFCVRTV